jgi:putative tricarboxylic transport membrane protein
MMCENPNATVQRVDAKGGDWRFLPSRDEIRAIRMTVVRSSLLGIFVGVLPGAGADIGSWVSYSEARRFARDKSQFGHGSIVGIAASETANNAVTGSSLIPLLTLGIPGSTTAAVLLGALIVHGLLPGRALFEEHASITYTVIFGFLVANVVMGVVGMTLGKFMVNVVRLPNAVIIPSIFILSIVGSYSLGNNFVDIYTMMAFGLLGYVMRKSGFHPAPMILGLILGQTAETGFRQSVTLANGPIVAYILGSPISLILAVLTLLSMGTAAYLESRRTRATHGATL